MRNAAPKPYGAQKTSDAKRGHHVQKYIPQTQEASCACKQNKPLEGDATKQRLKATRQDKSCEGETTKQPFKQNSLMAKLSNKEYIDHQFHSQLPALQHNP
jgi:hypothetical protein